MKTFFILPLILMALFLGACSEAPSSMAPIIEDVPELKIRLGLSNVEGFVSFDATTIPMVSGGSGDYLYELFQDGQSLGGDPVQVLHFTEVRVYQIKLKVTDRVTREEQEASVSFNGLQLPEGAKLENSLTCPKPIVRVEEDAFMYGVARGGSGNYSHRMFLAGELVGSVPIMQVTIHELGDNELVLETTDMDTGEVAYSDPFVVVGLDSDPSVMHVNLIALPQTVELDKYTGLITILHGGQGPFEFEIRVDGQVVAWQPTFMYKMKTLGELIVMVKVTDATGVSKETGLSIFGVEREVYEPPTTVDIIGSSHEEQYGVPIPLHAHVHEEYDSIEWWCLFDDGREFKMLGTGDDVVFNAYQLGLPLGIYNIEARVFIEREVVATDIWRVTVTPPDQVVVDNVTAAMSHGPVPRWTGVDADAYGGVGILDYVWRKGNDVIGYGESIDYQMTTITPDTLWVTVTDEIGQWDNGSVILTGEIDGTITFEWSPEPNLQVGPNGDFATTTATVEVTGDYDSFVQVEWDAVRAGELDAFMMEIVLSNGHRYTWRVDKPRDWGQMTAYYEVGDIYLEQGEVTLNMYWLGDNKSGEKCDGWDKWQLISGNTTIPLNKSGDAMVIRLDDPNRDQYIKRQ